MFKLKYQNAQLNNEIMNKNLHSHTIGDSIKWKKFDLQLAF